MCKKLIAIVLCLLALGCGDPTLEKNYTLLSDFNKRKIAECRELGGYAQTRMQVYGTEFNWSYYEALERCWFNGEKK